MITRAIPLDSPGGDEFFTADQHRRMQDLMAKRGATRDGQTSLSPEEQAELLALVTAELKATIARAEAILAKR